MPKLRFGGDVGGEMRISMSNGAMSAHCLDSVLLWFREFVEESGLEPRLDMPVKISLRREEVVGPILNTLSGGNSERKIGFATDLLRRTRRGYGDVPRLVEEVDGWLDQSIESFRKRIFEPGRINWVCVQPLDCVCH